MSENTSVSPLHSYSGASLYEPSPLLLPNEQLKWNKSRIRALLNGTIIVIAKVGNVIHSPSPDFQLICSSHTVPTPPSLRQPSSASNGSKLLFGTITLTNVKYLKHPFNSSLDVAIKELMKWCLSLAH